MMNKDALAKKVALVAVYSALGVVLAPFLQIPFITTKAFPGQHLLNAIVGVTLGPFWAFIVATIVGIIRNALGVGTIYAFPGGIPGGVIVGLFSWILKKIGKSDKVEYAAFSEPLGTVLIGGTLSVYLVAPLIGDLKLTGALIPVWIIFGVSSVIGSIMGFIVLKVLRRAGYLNSISTW